MNRKKLLAILGTIALVAIALAQVWFTSQGQDMGPWW